MTEALSQGFEFKRDTEQIPTRTISKDSECTLTLEEESVLKRVLLLDGFDHEIHLFTKDEHPLRYLKEESILLRYLFSIVLGDNPTPAVQKLMLNLPSIIGIIARATKKKDSTSRLFSTALDLVLRTPQEKEFAKNVGHAERFSQLVEDNISVRRIEGEEEILYESIVSARKEFINSAIGIYEDICSNPNGTKHFFEIIRNAKTISALPSSYKGVFQSMTTAILPRLIDDIKHPEKIESRKKVYKSFPRRTMYAILSMTNPFKMANSLVSLFLAKPLGSKNLAQKIMEVTIEFHRTQSQIKEIKSKKHLTKYNLLFQRIESWCKTYYEYDGSAFDTDEDDQVLSIETKREELVQILTCMEKENNKTATEINTGKAQQVTSPQRALQQDCPSLQINTICSNINESDLNDIHRLIVLEKRRMEKNEVLELFGDAELIDIIKELFPMICLPLSTMYNQVGIPHWFQQNFKWMKSIFTTGENKKHSQEQKEKELKESLLEYQESQYKLIHNLVNADKDGTLEKISEWIFKKFQAGDGLTVDLLPLVNSLGKIEKDELMLELQRLVSFEKFKSQLWKKDFKEASVLELPKHPAITAYLLKPFFRLLFNQLPLSTLPCITIDPKLRRNTV